MSLNLSLSLEMSRIPMYFKETRSHDFQVAIIHLNTPKNLNALTESMGNSMFEISSILTDKALQKSVKVYLQTLKCAQSYLRGKGEPFLQEEI